MPEIVTTGARPKGFSYVYKDQLATQIESIDHKQCFHNQYMHTCLLRATEGTSIDACGRRNKAKADKMEDVGERELTWNCQTFEHFLSESVT